MALTKCKECGQQVAKSAKTCPHCGVDRKSGGIGLGGGIVLALFSIMVFSYVVGSVQRSATGTTSTARPTSVAPAAKADTTQRHIHRTVNVRAGPGTDHDVVRQLARGDTVTVQETQEGWARIAEGQWVSESLLHDRGVPSDAQLQAQGLKWNYQERDDKMGRGRIRHAWVRSLNTVNFGFPYSGAQHATLRLRDHPEYGKNVILQIEQGQFLCGIDRCRVSVRFGDDKPTTYNVAEPADHSTTTLFISNYESFMINLRKVDRVAVEATFYQEGNRVFEFDVSGLQWN